MNKLFVLKSNQLKTFLTDVKAFLTNCWLKYQGKLPEQIKDRIIGELLRGVEQTKLPLYKALLENQYNYKEQTKNSYPTKMDMLPITKNVLDNMVGFELIGVQPMTGPVILLYQLKYTERETNEDGSKNLSLEIVANPVMANSSKLRYCLSMEATQDMKAQHGIDMSQELYQSVGSEISCELGNEIINDLVSVSHKDTLMLPESEHKLDYLVIGINEQVNEIARKSHRGPANFMVMSPIMVMLLQTIKQGAGSYIMPAEKPTKLKGTDLVYMGKTSSGMMKVYSSTHPELSDNKILFGYKGSEMDSGMFMCPYLPVVPTEVVLDPVTFTPQIKFLSRYGKFITENVSDYYTTLTIENMPISF